MLIFPYSTALTLGKRPWVCYAAVVACSLVFYLQMSYPVTQDLLYFPRSWNPLTMLSSSLAHANLLHLVGNIVVFMAFAPALETLIANPLRTIGIMVVLAFASSIGYSLSVVTGLTSGLPSLGFSGVVMGMIGLSASVMPKARIRMFGWFIFFWKIFYVPAWVLALFYIGFDTWTILRADNYGGINLVAHVSGGLAGYAIGFFFLKDRRMEVQEALDEEIEAMEIERKHGKTRAEIHRYNKRMDPILEEKARQREFDKFMGEIYRQVNARHDSRAVALLQTKYDDQSYHSELESVFERVLEWEHSRFTLCLGRLIIQVLDQEGRYGRALQMIEVCQAISPGFVLPDLSRVLFYAQMGLDAGKPTLAARLTYDAAKRYRGMVDAQQAEQWFQQAKSMAR